MFTVRLYPLLLCLLVSVLLQASCGGGGNSTSNSSNVQDIDPSVFKSAYFRLDLNGFDQYLDHSAAPADQTSDTGIMKVFDGNGDGYPDLLHVASYFRWNYTGNGPGYTTLNYYENNKQGQFINKTMEVFGTNEYPASPRKIKFLDINGDGIEDIFFASNREDGRTEDINTNNIGAENDIFLSQPDGTYKNINVGISAWTHDVQIGNFDSDNAIEMIDGNFTHGNRVYDLTSDGGWSESTIDVNSPSVFSAITNELANFNSDNCLDTVSPDAYPNFQQMAFYTGDCNGNFKLAGKFGPNYLTFQVPGEAWNGDPAVFEVAEIDGKWISGMGQDWSHSEDFDKDGDVDLLYILGATEALDSEIANEYIVEGSGPTYTLIVLLKNNLSGFDVIVNPVNNFPTDLNLYWATFSDINGNGYLDMVVDNSQPWANGYGLNDVIFASNQDGTFSKLDIVLATGDIIDQFSSVTPIDVNKDGIMDYVLRNMCIKSTANCSPAYENPFRLLIGVRNL